MDRYPKPQESKSEIMLVTLKRCKSKEIEIF